MRRFETINRGGWAAGCALGRLALALAVCLFAAATWSVSARASAVWHLDSLTNTTVAPGGVIHYNLVIKNFGDTPAPATTGGDANNCVAGSPRPSDPTKCTTVTAHFPPQLTPLAADTGVGGPTCTVQGASIVCPYSGSSPDSSFGNVSLKSAIDFTARVNPGVGGTVTSSFEISGGEAANVGRTVDPTLVSASPPTFGIDAFDTLTSADAAGDPLTQAGAHPYEYSTYITFNTTTHVTPLSGDLYPVESTRDILVDLPAGFLGDPTVADRCRADQLANSLSFSSVPLCPSTSQVGTATIFLQGNGGLGDSMGPVPVYNMVPPANAPARLGFSVVGTVVTFDTTLRTGGDYGLTTTVRGVPELRTVGTQLTLWGVPSDPVHDRERGCPGHLDPADSGFFCPSGAPRKAFLRNPTSCSPPGVGLLTTVSVDSWEHPGKFVGASTRSHLLPGFPYAPAEWGPEQGMEGCEKLPFEPSLTGGPPADAGAGSPSGFSFDLSLPQGDDPESLATADMKKAVIALPEGVRINPSSAQGLQGCTPAQVGLKSESEPACPDASKLGSVRIDSPDLSEPLTGAVYLATPYENPFGSLMAIYLVAHGQGVTIKLAGEVHLDPTTGQITTTIDNAPQAPFTKVHVQFDGGPRAALSLPQQCGTYTTHGQFSSWSGKTVAAESSFTIARQEDGQPCPPGGMFAPSFTGGSTNVRAGGFTPFGFSFSRGDSDEAISGVSETLPPGVEAILAGVPLCPDAQAASGACPQASRVGSVLVGSGAGSNPYFLKGSVYLTGPYNGGPFGEVVVVPAVAGPFNLGNVVVRGSIRVDPHTAQPSVVSDPLPQFVNGTGIPSDVRRVDVMLDRPRFTFNPTDCAPLALTGTLTSVGGAVAHLSQRFQVADCASLGFKPKFSVAATGHPTRKAGAGLSVKIAYPKGAQANLRAVKVKLPRLLPSRLSTLQKACTDKVFAANPAACPAESVVGTATVSTPVLASKLTGPAYFVSHGVAKFPDLVFVLQGEGVTVVLDGETFIDEHTSITTTTFRSVPDVPIGSFALSLPQGPHSALAGHQSLCRRKLTMPTLLVAQNGAAIRQNTKIAVSGCAAGKARRPHGR
jgi:hypothetical protein